MKKNKYYPTNIWKRLAQKRKLKSLKNSPNLVKLARKIWQMMHLLVNKNLGSRGFIHFTGAGNQ
nr:hypothetical protein [uncultured Desulfobacter sp.]